MTSQLVFLRQCIRVLGSFLPFFGRAVLSAGRRFLGQFGQFPLAYGAVIYLFFTAAFCYHPVIGHWLTGFMMMSLPLAIPAGLGACLYLLWRRQYAIGMAGLVWVLFSLVVARRVVSVGGGQVSEGPAPTLSVLSYNGETFPLQTATDTENALKADIACFQEYTPNPHLQRQYPASLTRLTRFGTSHSVGLALFSRYPIVRQFGRIWPRTHGPAINGFLCADIAYGADTIRVVNVHLWSMGVRTHQAANALDTGNVGRFLTTLADTFGRLKEGFEHRNEQLREVASYVTGSQYPVIICGDFNETPMGYSYGKLSQHFRNAFEEAGRGMGFTLNRHPYCVRIDQQFVSQEWQIRNCRTLSTIASSDHFPVMAHYTLNRPETTPARWLANH